MEKRDIIVIVIAIIIVLIMAMYIKPLVTGKQVKLVPDEIASYFGPKNGTSIINNTSLSNESAGSNASIYDLVNMSSVNTTNTTNVSITPSPVPTWNGSPVQVGLSNQADSVYMYPRPYPEQTDQIYSFSQESAPLLPYTNFSGRYSAKTNTFYVPSSYWEMWYTVDLRDDLQYPTMTEKTSSIEKKNDGTKVIPERTDSISVVNPYFSIKVLNADSNSVIRTVTPAGGLNPRLWKGDFASPDTTETFDFTKVVSKEVNWDPRPWKEKFFEGYKNYQLEVDARNLLSYSIEIKVSGSHPSSTNISQNQTSLTISRQPGETMDTIYTSYIRDTNGNISDPVIFGSIIQNLSQNVLTQKTNDEVFLEISHMKNAGISLTRFEKANVFFQGIEGSLKGQLIYSTKTEQKQIFVDIPFVQEYNGWKMNVLPLIRP